ncbi:MAG: helix-turn-helix domain-containing protein [Eubacteriales bacterium]|nr:helix-turn-helix domain-containing protein [Eubacteriales bacterium]
MLRIDLEQLQYIDFNACHIMASTLKYDSGDSTYYPEPRGDHMLYYLCEGQRRYICSDGREFMMNPHDVLLMPSDSRYETIVMEGGCRGVFIRFLLRDSDGLNVFLKGGVQRLTYDADGTLESLFCEVSDNFLSGRSCLFSKQKLYRLLDMIINKRNTAKQSPDERALAHAIEYMQAHLSETLSLESLARVSSMSQRTFCRRFKEHIGCPPMLYHRTLRIQKAMRLLQTNQYTVERIAAETGFVDAAHFCRCFKQLQGETVRHARQAQHALITPDLD